MKPLHQADKVKHETDDYLALDEERFTMAMQRLDIKGRRAGCFKQAENSMEE